MTSATATQVVAPLDPTAHPVRRRVDRWRRGIAAAGTLGATLGTFVCFTAQGVVLARMLGPEGRGEFAAAIAYPQMLLYLGLLGAADLFARRGAQLRPGDRQQESALRRSAALFGGLTGMLTMAACAALVVAAMPGDKRYLTPLALVAACTVPLQQIRLTVQAVDHGAGNWYRYNASRIVAAAVPPLLLLGLWIAGAGSVQTAMAGYVAAMLLALPLCQWGMHGRWWGHVDPPPIQALVAGRGFACSQVAAELLDRADIVLVLWLGTLAQQGWYTAAVPVAATMSIVPMAAAAYTFRRGAMHGAPLSSSQVTTQLATLFALQLTFGAALAASLPVLVPLLMGPAFEPSIAFAWMLLPAAGLRGVVIAADGYLRGRGQTRPGTWARLTGLALMVSASIGLQPALGAAAIPLALGIAQAVCLAIVAAAIYRDASTVGASLR